MTDNIAVTKKANAAARLFLLLLAALLFTTAWETDTRHQAEVIARRTTNSPIRFVATKPRKARTEISQHATVRPMHAVVKAM